MSSGCRSREEETPYFPGGIREDVRKEVASETNAEGSARQGGKGLSDGGRTCTAVAGGGK